jgi:integrase
MATRKGNTYDEDGNLVDNLNERIEELQAQVAQMKASKPVKTRKKKGGGLTDTKVRAATEGTYPDPAHPGLRLRVGKSKKTWLYRYRDKDKLKQVTLGQYFDDPKTKQHMTLAEARAKRDALSAVNKKDVKREHQLQQEGEETVTSLVDHYLDEYAKHIKRSWKEDKRMLEKDLTKIWGDRPAADVTRVEVMELLTSMVPRGQRGAQLLLAAARKAWNHAIDRDRLQTNPFARLKIVKGVVMGAGNKVRNNKPKPRCLRGTEIKTFLTKLPTSNMRQGIKDILLLQLLTANRKGEVCAVRWDEIDMDEKVWTIPMEKTKSEQEHRVMLSRQALKLIEAQPQVNDYVFGSKKTSCGHIRPDAVNEALSRCMDHFGLKHFTPHAMRHTALTGLSMLGANREIQNRCSNHKDSSIGGPYDHNELDAEARKWLQKWANHLDSLTADNVVPFDKAQ